jgi:uncharacterized protein YqfA (UPF0365 family)
VVVPVTLLNLLAQGELAWSLIGLTTIVAFIGLGFLFVYGRLYLQALTSGVPVRAATLIAMTLRRVPAHLIVTNLVSAHKAGLIVDWDKLEAHYLAGGNVPRVVMAIIEASRANIDLNFERASDIDLAGRDVLDAVNTSINPRIIDCPDARLAGRNTVDAVAKDGIQLRVRARVTVRTALTRLIGGATEETIIARVGEGIVSAIGSSNTYKAVLDNPGRISRVVLDNGLDSETAYKIVSIDISDVDVGDNIGAKLQVDQAQADMRVARAEAEKRRALAVARTQEMHAEVIENRAKVVLADAEVPRGLSTAFRAGNLGG